MFCFIDVARYCISFVLFVILCVGPSADEMEAFYQVALAQSPHDAVRRDAIFDGLMEQFRVSALS